MNFTPITPTQYSCLLDEYSKDLELVTVHRPPERSDGQNVYEIIKSDFYLQSAICEYLLCDRRGSINLTVPRDRFCRRKFREVFELAVPVLENREVYVCSFGKMKESAYLSFEEALRDGQICRIFQTSCENLKNGLEVLNDSEIVFFLCKDEPDGGNDSDEEIPNFSQGCFNFPALFRQNQLNEEPLFKRICSLADKVVFAGRMEDGEFISHGFTVFVG